jgi:hypothetical protein
MGKIRNVYKIFVRKSHEIKPRHRWEDDGPEDVDWIHLV